MFLSWTGSANTALDLVDQVLDLSVDGGSSFGTNAPLYNDGQTLSLGALTTTRLVEGLTNGTSSTRCASAPRTAAAT